MHELGIVTHIAKTLQGIAEEKKLKEIAVVVLEVGEVSGIVHSFIIDCWNFYKKKIPLLQKSELQIESFPGVTFCENCKKTYDTVTHGKICPYCESTHTYLVSGSECLIKQIEAL